jgi:hypothetical protein
MDVASFEMLSWYLLGQQDESQENLWPGKPISEAKVCNQEV